MKKLFEKINWKILNLAFWIEIILSYILPFKVTDNFQYQVGIPIPFISVYATRFSISPFMSMHFSPSGLLFNGIIIYLLIILCTIGYQKITSYEGSIMNNIVLIIVGLIFLVFVVIYPLPTMLAVSGIAWRIIIGLLGCFLLVLGIYKATCKR